MATRQGIEFVRGDDPFVQLRVTRAGVPFDLTGRRVEVLVKASRTAPDAAQLYRLSTVGEAPAIVITDPAGGIAVADFSDRAAEAGTWWFRAWTADAADDALDRQTFAYGPLSVTNA